ncbi:MAG: DUF5312 family protein [Spirochaetaceae bacterium]|jgi:hypothetical protein|nr:DUF5312 family protein [Spirochaetaceae bacterium]
MWFIDFFSSLFSNFSTGTHKTEKTRHKLLRRIARDIKKSGFGKFYHPSTKTLLPAFATYMYLIYLYSGNYIGKGRQSKAIELEVIRYFLNSSHEEALEKVSYDYIKEQSLKLSPEMLEETHEKNIESLRKLFTPAWVDTINKHYNLIVQFTWIIGYDYYSLLNLFDISLRPKDYFSKTNFSKVRSFYAKEYIKDFIAVTAGLNKESNWRFVFDVLNSADTKKISMDNWLYVVNSIEKLKDSKILENIIKHTEDNPYWESSTLKPNVSIAFKFINDILNEAKKTMGQVKEENKNGIVDSILRDLYNNDLQPLSYCYYNPDLSVEFESHGFTGFIYTDKINHSRQFLNLYYNDIKQLCDVFIVHGVWTVREDCSSLSSALITLTSGYEALESFCHDFEDEGKLTQKAKFGLEEFTTKANAREKVRNFISNINLEAGKITVNILKPLDEIRKTIAKLNIESNNKQMVMMLNWNTLEPILLKLTFSIAQCEKKISDLLTLLNWYDKTKER